MNYEQLIQANAQKINKLAQEVKQTQQIKKTDPTLFVAATDAFNTQYDLLAFPGGLKRGLALLKEQDPKTIDVAIAYLKADPYFFRSGYIKQKIALLLKQASLSPDQIKQLHEVIIEALQKNGRREFLEYCRLARKISNQTFKNQIENIIEQSDSAKTVYRAHRLLHIIREE